MGFWKPLSVVAASAGGPVGLGLVAAGFAAAGYIMGARSANRGPDLRVEFIEPAEQQAPQADEKRSCRIADDSGSEEAPETLLEYYYEDSPIVPSGMMRRMAYAAAPPSEPPSASFSLDLADSLLKLALDAYSHPPPGVGYTTTEVKGLPMVTFFDKEIMKAIYSGVLVVRLEGATGLRSVSGKGAPSPYAEVFVMAGSFSTKAAKQTGNPVWNTSSVLFIRNTEWDALTIDVFDNNRTTDKLGTAVLGLAQLKDSDGAEVKFRLPLRGVAGEAANVTLTCRYLDFSKVDPDTIPEIKPATPTKAKQGTYGTDKVAGMTRAAFVDNQSSDTQVWLYSNAETRELVFAFRGTETSQVKDVITDANLVPCAFKSLLQQGDKAKEKVSVHRGFMGAYESVRRQLSSLLHAITMTGPGGPWTVRVTGHSLGGALATLAAYELASYRAHAGNIESVTLYTYGCPRVGNPSFATDFNQVLPDAWRVTNRLDVVPSVPPSGWMFKFTHVGNPVRLRPDGCFHKGVENLKDDVEKEINWLVSLVSFNGVKEHGGDYYQQMLTNAINLVRGPAVTPATASAKGATAAAAGAKAVPIAATAGK